MSQRRVFGPQTRIGVILLVVLGVGSGLLDVARSEEKVKRGDRGGGGGGSLSDAARETAKKPSEQRVLHTETRNEGAGAPTVSILVDLPQGAPGPCFPPGPPPSGSDIYGTPGAPGPPRDIHPSFHAGVVAESGSLSSPDFSSGTLYGLRIGINDRKRTSFDLMFLGGNAHFTPGSDLAALFRHPEELALDASLRYSLTRPDAPCGIAPVVGFRVGWLSWRYANGIWLDQDGYVSQVFDDRVRHYSPYLGLAVTVLRSRHAELGVAGITGARYYCEHADSGLRNDLFPDDSYYQLRLETRMY